MINESIRPKFLLMFEVDILWDNYLRLRALTPRAWEDSALSQRPQLLDPRMKNDGRGGSREAEGQGPQPLGGQPADGPAERACPARLPDPPRDSTCASTDTPVSEPAGLLAS